MNKSIIAVLFSGSILFFMLSACSPAPVITPQQVGRETSIPADAVKMTTEIDKNPPLSLSNEYEHPVPVEGKVNSAGAEDSVFITPEGNTMYFFFTPDVDLPAERQIVDGVTGIYVSFLLNGEWIEPERIILQDPGKLALDGCEFVQGNTMWFCSTREGYDGIHWFTAEYMDGIWQLWKKADFNPSYQVGELHFSSDHTELYFHSEKPGGEGGLDIWVSKLTDGKWQQPENISAVNTPDPEGWPALNPSGDELWFYRNWGIWRSKRSDGEWMEPEQIIYPFAGEPSVDKDGNLFFIHHFFAEEKMIEADIYMAKKSILP